MDGGKEQRIGKKKKINSINRQLRINVIYCVPLMFFFIISHQYSDLLALLCSSLLSTKNKILRELEKIAKTFLQIKCILSFCGSRCKGHFLQGLKLLSNDFIFNNV